MTCGSRVIACGLAILGVTLPPANREVVLPPILFLPRVARIQGILHVLILFVLTLNAKERYITKRRQKRRLQPLIYRSVIDHFDTSITGD